MKKYFTFLLLLSYFVLVGCVNVSNKQGNVSGSIQDAGSENAVSFKTNKNNEPLRVIEVNARRFAFESNEIRVQQGEKVALKINDLDTPHGAQFDEMDVWYEENGNIILDTSKPGVYTFRCATYCGAGHIGMKGRVIVE